MEFDDQNEVRELIIKASSHKAGIVSGYVYVMRGKFKGETLYKIGYSIDPYRRASQLRSKFPSCGARVRHMIKTNDPIKLETSLHIVFAKNVGKGPSWEWFKLSPPDVDWLMDLDYVDMTGF